MAALRAGGNRVLQAVIGILLIAAVPGWAAERVALVIGNAAYEQEAAALKNPVNDATAMAAALGRLGFEVIAGTDLDEDAFYDKITEFEEAARSADIALFFYAGHGLQVEGRNYLAPVDLRLRTKQDLRRHAIELGAALEVMRSETNVVILDACRDNPLAAELAHSQGISRTVAARRGLARVEAARGTLIAYATEPGRVAADGVGEHSPYTAALLEHLETPGLSVTDLFTLVTASVLASTGGGQNPWTHTSLFKVVRLASAQRPDPLSSPPSPSTARDANSDRLTAEELAAERLFWESVKEGANPADLQAYLDRYPEGVYVVLARSRLQALQEAAAESAAGEGVASVEAGLKLSRADRRVIQLGLKAEGFDPGPADGLIGPGTRGAIRKWQASRGMDLTAHLDAESANVLLTAGAKVHAQEQARREADARVRREAQERQRRESEKRAAQQRADRRKRPLQPGSHFRDCPGLSGDGGGAPGGVYDGVALQRGAAVRRRGCKVPRHHRQAVRGWCLRGDAGSVCPLCGGHGIRHRSVLPCLRR